MIHQYLIPSYYSSVSNVFSSVWVDPSKIWHRYIFDQKILIELNKHQSRLAPLSVFNVCMLECVCVCVWGGGGVGGFGDPPLQLFLFWGGIWGLSPQVLFSFW